jgi:hypothetical protein
LNYLTNAGYLLARSVPEVSSFLMLRRHAMTVRLGLSASEIEKQAVCTACGNIVVPGCSGRLEFEADRAFKRRRRRRNQNAEGKKPTVERFGPSKVMTCQRCRSVSKMQLPAPPAMERRNTKPPQALYGKQGAEPVAAKGSSNAASKKRAKARKAGLQGLLASSKAASSNSRPALTLASFLKK